MTRLDLLLPGKATRSTVRDALIAREWLVSVLLRGVHGPPPDLDPRAWEIAFYQERCAALLLQQNVSTDSITESNGLVLARRAAAFETQRILSARAHITLLDNVASRTGLRLALLKGAVALAYGHNVVMNDLDVLAEPGQETAVASALDAIGFTPRFDAGRYHLEPRVIEHTLPIEVHRAVLGLARPDDVRWDNVLSVPSLPSLVHLNWPDHVWTVLCQMVLKHPDRLYRIRDLFLVKTGLSACNPAERAVLDSRASAHPLAREFRTIIGYCTEDIDQAGRARIRRALVRGYLVLARTLRNWHAGVVSLTAHHMLETAMNGYRSEWRRRVGTDIERPSESSRFRRAALQIAVSGLTTMVTVDSRLIT